MKKKIIFTLCLVVAIASTISCVSEKKTDSCATTKTDSCATTKTDSCATAKTDSCATAKTDSCKNLDTATTTSNTEAKKGSK